MERRVISNIFQQLAQIVRPDRGILEMGYDCLILFHQALELDSAAMLTRVPIQGNTLWVYPQESLPKYSQEWLSPLVDNPEEAWFFTKEDMFNYCFRLPESSLLVLQTKSQFHHLLFSDVVHVVQFISDYFSAINDRNQKRSLEQQLRHERNLMRSIIDSIPETLAFKDLSETYQLTNKQADMEYSNRFPSIVGKTISEVYPESERVIVRAMDQEVIQTGKSIRKEVDMFTDRGFVRYDAIRTPVYDESNHLIGIVSIGRDISETIKIRDNLARNNAFQDILVRIANNFINIQSEDVDYMINEAIKEIGEFINADRAYVFEYDFVNHFITNTHEWCNTGVNPEINNLQQLPLDQFADDWVNIHQQGNEVFIPNIDDMDHTSMTYEILLSQGIRSVISVPMMRDGRCIGFVGFDDVKDEHFWNEYEKGLLKVLAEIITNLYTQKEREQMIVSAKEAAQKASTAKTEFLANMSHEIRTPLSGIYNAIYLLNTTNLSDEQHHYLEIGHSSVEMLSSIVNNILDISKIEANKMELNNTTFNLEDELFQIIQLEELVALDKGIQLHFDFDYRIQNDVISDSVKIRQIVLNLVNNAIKFTRQGSVNVSVRLLKTTPDEIRLRCAIRDTGIGISEEHIQYLTEEFYQVDSSISKEFQGSGLGLSIANKLLGLFSSQLDIHSVLGEGSEFSFELSLKTARSRHYDTSILKDKNILIISENIAKCPIRDMLTSLNIRFKEVVPNEEKLLSIPQKSMDIAIYSTCIEKLNPNVSQWIRGRIKRNGFSFLYGKDAAMEEIIASDVIGFHEIRFGAISRNNLLQLISRHYSSMIETKVENKQELLQSGLSILIVDDNRINRKALEMLMHKHNFIIHTAENGIDAVEKASNKKYDYIFMDIQMPGMNGIEATKIIRSTENPNRQSIIIALTAHAFQSEYDTFLDAGMNDIITKPINLDMLFEMMRKHHQSSQHSSNISASVRIPDEFSIFQRTEFIERFHDFRDLAFQVLNTYLEEEPSILQEMRVAHETGNDQLLHEKAHYLKGSCDYISAQRISWISRNISKCIKEHDINQLHQLMDLLFYEAELLRESLISYIEEMNDRKE